MRYLFLITFFVCISSGLLQAQQKKSFLESIKSYESELNIKFSYDPSVVELISKGFEATPNLEYFIKQVESSLPVNIQKISDDYYTIVVTKSQYSLTLIDSLESTTIEPPFFILINSNPANVQIKDGKAIFSYKPVLQDTIIAYAPGYEKKLIAVTELINQKKISINLMTQTFLLNDVLIEDYLTKGINMDPINQNITISVKDLPLLPGETDGDIFASLAALPGITTPDGRPGNLFIRGNSVDQSLILFDNIPIYHRGHYFGTISPYNPKMVDNVEVYRSGYHPRMGGRVGGAVFVSSDEEVTNQPQYGVGMNTLYAMAYGKTPLANNKVGLAFGARHSYPSSIKSPKLNAISKSVFSATGVTDDNGNIVGDVDVSFQDYHTKLIIKPHIRHKLSVTGIYSKTSLFYQVFLGPGQLGPAESINFENYGLSLKWDYDLNENWTSSFVSTISDYSYTNRTPNDNIELFAINQIKDHNSRIEISSTGRKNHALQLGVDYKWQSTDIDYSNNLSMDPTPVIISNTVAAHTLSPFVNLEWFDSKKWHIQAGLRGTYYGPRNSLQWSPRVAVNYEATPGLSLKMAAGAYNQYLSQVKNLEFGGGGFDNELWMLTGDQEGNIISGRQYMAGFLFHENSWLFDLEAYRKTANSITYYEDRRFNNRGIYFTSDDEVFGIDAYLKKRIGEFNSAWLGYSYSNTKITIDTTDQVTYKSKYVQPHVIYLGTAYQKDRWKFSATWKFGSGLNAKSLEIAFAEVIYQRAQARREPGTPPAPNPFADVPERYPYIHSMDLSASYKIPKTEDRKWSASFGLSVINVFNRENLIDRAFRGNPPPPRFIDRNALGFAPNLMMIIEW